MTTNVPAPVFGPNGFIIPSEADVLAGRIADWQAAFNNKLNLDPTDLSTLATPQGQLVSSDTAVIGQANDTFLLQSQMTDPAYAFGRWQDAICRIYFIERIGAQPTIIQVVCTGAQDVVIPVGALIQDTSGFIYACTAEVTIPAGGSVTTSFANQTVGPIAVPGTDEVSIYQAIPSWDLATVASGVLGNNEESRSEFEVRRASTVAGNSFGAIGSIIGALSQVMGVTDYFGYDNATAAPVVVSGVTVAANSIYIAAVGGTDADVAQAIWSKKSPGCAYTGNTTVVVFDDNPLYASPIPYNVTFERPTPLQILFAVNLSNNALVPSNATLLVQAAIINAFAGGDGGPRARIGSMLFASRFYSAVAALGSWVQIIDIFVGSNNTHAASFTGAIAGTALTTSSVTGTIAIGQTISGAGVVAGTQIVSGSGSSWVVSVSQTVSSEAMLSAVANLNVVSVNANQEPEIVADNILVTLV